LFSLLSENVNITIEETLILPVVLYECEKRSLTHERTPINRMFRGIFCSNRDGVTGEKLIMRKFVILCSSASTVKIIHSNTMRWSESLKKRDWLKDLGIAVSIILKLMLKK
jgi:hypothetical protein